MKIQLDTTAKRIKIEEEVNLGEFISMLEKLLPNNEWHKFKLETVIQINNWNNPIVIDRFPPHYVPYPYRKYPFWEITCGTETGHTYLSDTVKQPDYTLKQGTFCLQLEKKKFVSWDDPQTQKDFGIE